MTYWVLNAIFLGVVAIVLGVAALVRRQSPERLHWPAIGVTAAILLVMTAVFDNVMIGIGLVAYNEALISGAFIGIAPLEDFAYAVAAVVGLPSLWALLGSSRARGPSRAHGVARGRSDHA
ncbi:lycopene cyclase domain-containing protein [Salinibacterium sp.]|uniref:lycopene cyclase domain-containing protein n=1 Tax=Salinibacterium sp. TaxID=1915057 RepID=UPI00286BA1A4|nr:lycopene cyclase domain-containing protein [Salinibacterium sp.]